MKVSIHDRANKRWLDILTALGIPPSYLSGRHGPCPLCGGKDRWRWDDRGGSGSWICSHCGAGNGVDLVMKFHKLEFREAAKLIESKIGGSEARVPDHHEMSDEERRAALLRLWEASHPLDGSDIASRYLVGRGISLEAWPTTLRWTPALAYKQESGSITHHPGILAKFASWDGKRGNLHRTWLKEPGVKAEVTHPKKMFPGKFESRGGAARLIPWKGGPIGIAEGIETALSAHILYSIPVWAGTSGPIMAQWKPPEGAEEIYIFADKDQSFAGHYYSYSLAYRLKAEGFKVLVEIPDIVGYGDFNDVLMGQKT